MRERLPLAGTWRFQLDPHNVGERLGWMNVDYESADWPETTVPDIQNEYAAPDNPLRGYEGVLWYARAVNIPRAWSERRIRLRFEGVNYDATVWVNGHQVGQHTGAFVGFAVDVPHEILRFDGEDLIVVKTDNRSLASRAPGPMYGWWNQGGLYRDVFLESRPQQAIDDISVQTNLVGDKARLRASVRVVCQSEARTEASIEWHLLKGDGTVVASGVTESVPLNSGIVATYVVETEISEPLLWSPDTPHLYDFVTSLKNGKESLDTVHQRVGVREIKVEGNRLLLNGKEILLKGVNRHEDYPTTGRAHDSLWLRRDLAHLKELGINFIRTSHYPNHPEFYEQTDQQGFLVMDEVPLYWWGVEWPGLTEYDDSEAVRSAEAQLAEMIQRDRNHPSIIFWSVSNETGSGKPAVDEANRHLIKRAKELDPSRLAVHVSMNWHVDTAFDTADVICINEYVGLHRNAKIGIVADLQEIEPVLGDALTNLQRTYPDKPIIVTEFGCVGISGIRGDTYPSEDFQAAYVQTHLNVLTQQPNVKGLVYWAYADYPYHRRYTRDYYPVGYYGLVTRDRTPKLVAKILKDALATWSTP